MKEKFRKALEKQQYRLREHAAVKVCRWTKKALRSEGFCYKQKFYKIESHRCLQFTPSVACNFRCKFCWRAHPEDLGLKKEQYRSSWQEPSQLVDKAIEDQRSLLSGFGGNPKVSNKKLKEAFKPNQAAISLTGEPTLYPKLPKLIEEFSSRGFTTFLVSNGSRPAMLKKLTDSKLTQLYLTLPAPSKKIFEKACKPRIKRGWKLLIKSLSLLSKFSCRTVIRLTLVKNLNMFNPGSYAKLLQKAKPDFVEAKAFMSVGYARKRIPYEWMPSHQEIGEFAKQLQEASSYQISNEKEDSRVIQLFKS